MRLMLRVLRPRRLRRRRSARCRLHVDVAAGEEHARSVRSALTLPASSARDADGAGAFDDLALLAHRRGGCRPRSRPRRAGRRRRAGRGTCAKVSRLSRPMPPPSESASVGSSSTGTGRPASRLAFIAAPRAIDTPITRAAGLERLDRGGDAGRKPAARQRHQHRRRRPARPR